jgi:hypothetical protein
MTKEEGKWVVLRKERRMKRYFISVPVENELTRYWRSHIWDESPDLLDLIAVGPLQLFQSHIGSSCENDCQE